MNKSKECQTEGSYGVQTDTVQEPTVLEVNKPARKAFVAVTSALIKRGFDFLIALVGLIVLSPVFLLVLFSTRGKGWGKIRNCS